MGDTTWPLVLLTLMSLVTSTGQNERQKRQIMADQPRIITENGHLIFQSGQNRNITFKSGSGGVYIDNLDLKFMATQTVSNKELIASLQATLGSGTGNVTNRLNYIEQQFIPLSSLPGRVSEVSTSVTNLGAQSIERHTSTTIRLNQVEAQKANLQLVTDLQGHVTSLRTRVETIENSNRSSNQGGGGGSGNTGGGGGGGGRRLNARVNALEAAVRNLEALLTTNECLSNPCSNGGTCVDVYSGYICRCPSNWQGPRCTEDVNECYMYTGTDLGCQNGATCYNSLGSFSCQCATDWHGIHCSERHNDCDGASHQELCGHGSCINDERTQAGVANYRCICNTGWTSSPGNPACVVDIDECTSSRHCSLDPPVMCINIPGSFVCGYCPSGYVGNGYTCSDINECATNNGGCSSSPSVQCTNTRGSRSCGPCPAGYQGDGVTCSYVGFCNINNGGCHSLATCSDGGNNRFCTCPQGYVGSGEGANGCQLQSQAGGCASSPCQNGAQCIPSGNTAFICVCRPGYTGPTCSSQVDACASNPCQNSGTCVSQSVAPFYNCQCPNDFTGNNCEQAQDGCGGNLQGETGSFRYPMNGYPYSHLVNCAWVITTNENKILTVTFPSFALENGVNCDYDFLQIHDGPSDSSHMIGRYCGNQPPNGGFINSTSNQLYLWFKSDSSITDDGFQVNWTSHAPSCGSSINGTNFGTIKSPGFPRNYPHNRDCVWVIFVRPGRNIVVTFAHLAIENHPSCSYDYLEIRDGETESASSLGKFCSSQTPEPIHTTGPYAYIKFHSDSSDSDVGFQMTYTSLTNDVPCGGYLTEENGVIRTPGYPGPYNRIGLCVWAIRAAPSSRVQLTILDLDLGHSTSCIMNALTIRDGSDERTPALATFCDITVPPAPITSSNRDMLVELRTDLSFSGKLRAQWTTVCGGIYTNSDGQIQSPNWPDSYAHDKECDYRITVSDTARVRLQFTSFGLEADEQCDFDYIEIYDGASNDAPMIGSRLCGDSVPSEIMSSNNNLFLKFVTDGSVSNTGFQATYTSVEGGAAQCGDVLRLDTGIISSPGHPSNYPHGVNCTWYIFTQPGFIIRLTFNVFNIEASYDNRCYYDYVEVYDNSTIDESSKIGKFCGSTNPGVLTSTDNAMVVSMKTDFNDAREGFTASYTAINASSICGSHLTAPNGVIVSPNYPNHYQTNRHCEWTISVADYYQIELNITDLDIGTAHCVTDFLEIRNGGYRSSPLIYQLCGQNIPAGPIISYSNKLFLLFRSGSYYSGRGFRIEYMGERAGCGGDITNPSGGIVSPNYPNLYPHYLECYYTITVSRGSSITLFFVDFDLESLGCTYDYLEVREDGPTGRFLQKLCGNVIPNPITTVSNRMWLAFKSDSVVNRRGFQLQYHSNCNNRIRGNSGIIESPNFPNQYNVYSNCSWVIEVPKGNTINVTFASFRMESGLCNLDYLRIRDGGDSNARELKTLCGADLPEPLSSTGNQLWLNFVSNPYYSSDGFRLEWIVNGCGGHLYGNTGTITSPNYPNLYPHDRECEWIITVDTGNSIEITISDFDMESSTGCRYDALEIYAGSDRGGPRIIQLCHTETQSQTVHTTGGTAVIVFKTDNSVNGRGFSMTYKAHSGGCGGNFTARSAAISSINYPNNYEHNTECEWNITVDPGHVVVLNLTDFQLENEASCGYDYVKLYEGSNSNATLIATLCGLTMPAETVYKSNGNHMFIRMQTDSSSAHKGFYAIYTTGCGGTLNADIDGEIFSPGYPGRYSPNTQCVWIISSSIHDRRVSLTFTHMDINSDCTVEYVIVNDGMYPVTNISGAQQNAYCGSSVPATITSEGSALNVVFKSSGYVYGIGFRAVYSSAVASCGAELIAESGRFISPNYPHGYPVNIECVWQIKTSPGNQIQISFPNFQLDPLGDINDDYLEIRSPNVTGPIVGRWIRANAPSNMTAMSGAWIKFRSNEGTTAPGFTAEYSSLFGGDLVGDSGQIASPRYPHLYPANIMYRWTILAPQGMRILVTFNAFSLEQPNYERRCTYDYVKLFDGTEENDVLLGIFCGSDVPSPLVSETNQITVIFRTDSSRQESGFLLSWLAVTSGDVVPTPPPFIIPTTQVPGCGGQLVAEDTVQNFTSPGFPGSYSSNLNCVWTISAPEGYTIIATITSMDVELSHGCYYADFVFVTDGDNYYSRYISRFCGTQGVGQVIRSTSNTLRVQFYTNSENSGNGFSINYKLGCGGRLTSPVGVIKSPLYPNSYPANQTCSWKIQVRVGKTISIDFSSNFNIAGSGECNNDYVMLLNGDSQTSPPLYRNGSTNTNGRYCGVTPPNGLETSSNNLFVNFVSDGSDEGSGFNLTYRTVSVACGGELRLTNAVNSGYIQTPNYPQNYPHNVECIWRIIVPSSQRIQVDFVETFNLENHAQCVWDYVEFHDGGTTNSRRIGRPLCGSTLPGTIVSTGNVLLVRFQTDSSLPHSGFKAKYSIATCGGRITANSGLIQSPKYPQNYDNNADCEWVIVGSVGHFLGLNITNFALQSSDNCTADSLVIRDGNATDRVIFEECGYSPFRSLLTSDNVAYVRFKSDSTGVNSGFKILFQASLEECGGQMNLPSGTIKSPGYPRPYTHSRICTWEITVPLGRRVTFTFTDFQLESHAYFCYRDFVEIFNGIIQGSPTLGRFCGTNIPSPIESSGNTMKVRFQSDDSLTYRGFMATYTSDREAECGGVITEGSGNITSPRFGNGTYSHSVQCLWSFQNRLENSSILLRVINMSLESHQACDYDYLEIREGEDLSGPLLGKLCGVKPDTGPYIVPTNDVSVRFKTDTSITSSGFMLAYTFTECGGMMTDSQGVITSPSYTTTQTTIECAWKIDAPDGAQIRVSFTDFAFVNTSNCNNGSLQIQNGGLPDSPTIGKYCGTTLPSSFVSQSNQLRFTLRANVSSDFGRFRLEYSFETGGCGLLYHSNQGSFSTPNYPSSYPHNVQCQWDINVQAGYIINLWFLPPFDLQASNCTRDYVEVFDALPNGILSSLGRWCHNIDPPQQRSTSNRMLVVFQSDATTNGNGFSARWDVQCGGIFTAAEGALVSPGYPNLYPNNLKCNYTISPGSQHHIAITFTDFELEGIGYGFCSHDYVMVWQGNTSVLPYTQLWYQRRSQYLGKFCGSSLPGPLRTTNQMTLQFITDGSVQFKGFRAEYQSEECGGVFTNSSGIIRTPLHPTDYAHYMNCAWNITVEPNRIIKLKFNAFSLEYHHNCRYDYIDVYDGPDTNSSKLGRYCGGLDNIPKDISSSGNQMYINFITDYSAAADGFSGGYWTTYGPAQGCGGTLRQSQGTIKSVDANGDGQYEAYLHCEWWIYVDINHVATFAITGLDIQASENCISDSLKIYDGSSADSPVLWNLCNRTFPHSPFLASTNAIYVVFHTDDTGSGAGFNASFGESPVLCGGAYNATSTPETITSPNYPHSTTIPIRCTWFIDSLNQNKNIRITVTDFQLQMSTNCDSEYLIFMDQRMGRNGENITGCGDHIPQFDSRGPVMRIVYALNTGPSLRGFQLTYQIADCNQNISIPSGRITSPGFPDYSPLNSNCAIRVTTPENTTLALYFKSFELEYHVRCGFDSLEILNSSSTSVGKLCGSSLPPPFFMSDNEATLKFVTDYSAQHSGYDITFISSSQGIGCGGNLTHLNTGTFTSPRYPNPYMEAATCSWRVTPPAQRPLWWRIYFLHTPQNSSNCNVDYLALYSGLTNTGTLLQHFCRLAQASSTPQMVEGPMFVQYVSTGNGSAPIFRFVFATSSQSLNPPQRRLRRINFM